jgi:peptide/nickel transport system permease protein
MTRFLSRRLLNYIVLLALASFLTFSLTSLTFSPLDSLLQRNPRPPQAVIDAKTAELDLDKPIPVRYVKWVSGAIHGDFGTTVNGQPVSDELGRRIGVTLRLVVIGSLLGTMIGVLVGAWGAIRQYRLSDRVITVLSLLVLSTPTFVIANLLILGALRVNSILGFQLFEYTGETSSDAAGGAWEQFAGRLQHLVLPTVTLALGSIAIFSRYQRNAMLDVLGQDYIRTARAKGLTRRQALLKHGLRTALIPMATLFAYGVAGLFGGAVFVEKIFGWHGMGEWFVQGISTQDTNIVAAIVLFAAVIILLAALLSDVIYGVLDPRVRMS